MRLIDADELKEFLNWTSCKAPYSKKQVLMWIDMARAVDAVPSQLTKEEIKTIRIHMNAFKEKLCNLHRYKEADDYQQIVEKLDTMMDAERKEHEADKSI